MTEAQWFEELSKRGIRGVIWFWEMDPESRKRYLKFLSEKGRLN